MCVSRAQKRERERERERERGKKKNGRGQPFQKQTKKIKKIIISPPPKVGYSSPDFII